MAAESAYDRIVSHVDQETCVLLRAEMYQGEKTRKILTAAPERIAKEGSVWVAHEVLMQDLRDETQTRLVVEEMTLEAPNEGIPFTPEDLRRYKAASGQGL